MTNVTRLEDIKRMNAVMPDAEPASATAEPAIPEFIKPRSIADMSDTEADAHLIALRDRRMKMAAYLKEQEQAKANVASAVALHKIEKKIGMVKRAEEKLVAAFEKMEEQLHQLRALRIQHGD